LSSIHYADILWEIDLVQLFKNFFKKSYVLKGGNLGGFFFFADR